MRALWQRLRPVRMGWTVCFLLVAYPLGSNQILLGEVTPSGPIVILELVDQEDIYISGEEGYHTYRIPSLLVAADGTLLAFCEGRKHGRGDSGDIDLLLKRWDPAGKVWTHQSIVWDDGPNTCGNPCPVLDRQTGTIWLWMTHNLGVDREPEIVAKKSRGTRTVWLTHSNDNGRTWSPPMDMTEKVKLKNWTWYATGPGCGIQTQSGRLVIPCDHVDDAGNRGSHVLYSDDHGQTWHLGGSAGPQTNECEVVELAGGRLLLNMRNYNRKYPSRAIAESFDGGLTWSAVRYDMTLVEPICQASIRRIEGLSLDGQPVIAFSNPADPKERKRLTVRVSADSCESWPWGLEVWPGPAAYSCLASLADGTLLVLYERGNTHPYERITLARIAVRVASAP
ncbi:sialidase family protein [Thermogutta sp.]|uniref:sialidase family protein n=1 Tax=Thermogutta sp. TaxID=1962930 RepID=UPI003C7DF43D